MDLLDRKPAAKFSEDVWSACPYAATDARPRNYVRDYAMLFASRALTLFRLRIRDDMDAT